MSVYGTLNPAPSVARGVAYTVWNAETPTPGNGTTAASQEMGMVPHPNTAEGVGIHGKFSGDPGAFKIEVQCSDTNSDTEYQTISGGIISSVDATSFTFHLDAPTLASRWIRLLMRSRTNSVTVTATIQGR
jgi:hypothetical protein